VAKPSNLALPPPRTPIRRDRKVLVSLTSEEHDGLVALAEERDEPPASLARSLIVAALKALRTER
jgi:hypothetical protein